MDNIFGNNAEQLQMLLMVLEDLKHGICLFQSEEQSGWVAQIRKGLKDREAIVHNIAEDDEKAGMPDITDFRRWAGESDAGIVIVYNLQLLGLRFGDREAVERLNFMRDQIQHIGKLFLFGVSPYFGLLLSRNARDLYSCIRYYFKFVSVAAGTGKSEGETYRELGGDCTLELEKYWEYKKRARNQSGEERLKLSLECMDSWRVVRGNLPFGEKEDIRQMAEAADQYYRRKEFHRSDVAQIWILADTWLELEEKEKGFYWYRLATDKVREELGEGHELYAEALAKLAVYHQMCSNYEESEECCDKALRIFEGLGKPPEGNYQAALLLRAVLYSQKSQAGQALAIYERLMQYYTKKYGSGYLGNVVCLNNIGRVYKGIGDASGALAKYQEALGLLLASGERRDLLGGIYGNIATLYLENGDTKNAWKNLKLAKRVTEELYGQESSHMVGIYNGMSGVWDARGRLDKTLECLEKAVALMKRTHSDETADAASVYSNMAIALMKGNRTFQAIPFLRRVLHLRLKIYGERNAHTADTYEGLALAFYRLSDMDACRENLKKAEEIYAELYGKDSPEVDRLEQFGDLLRTGGPVPIVR